jgi:AAA domain (dynein-related subfamily)
VPAAGEHHPLADEAKVKLGVEPAHGGSLPHSPARDATLWDVEDQAAAVEALGVAIAARVPVLLWGAPGTGKTSVVRAMAAAADWPCETVIASIREPADFAGLPIVNRTAGGDHERVDFAPPRWAVSLAAAGHGVAFFDEISTAPPAVQAALLRVVLERTVGDLVLPDDVSVVAAANPPEQAADGWDLSPPLANRFCHLEWPVDARTVAGGFSAGWGTPEPPRLEPAWEQRVPVMRSWIAGFITVRPMLAIAVPDDAAGGGRAWPSPRTWDMAARLQAAAESAGTGELATSLLIRGCVGAGAGVEFVTWLAEADLPDPEAVLARPESFMLPARGDRAYAALSSVAAAVAANPTPDRWERGWKAFARAAEAAPDVAAAAARTLARCRPAGAAIPPEVKSFAPLLRDAGLIG